MNFYLLWVALGINRGITFGTGYEDAATRCGGYYFQENSHHKLSLPAHLFNQPSPYPWSHDKWYIRGDFKLAIPEGWDDIKLHMEQLPSACDMSALELSEQPILVLAA